MSKAAPSSSSSASSVASSLTKDPFLWATAALGATTVGLLAKLLLDKKAQAAAAAHSRNSSYKNPTKKTAKIDAAAEQLVTSPPGCDLKTTFKGMGVRGFGQPFEWVEYHPRPLGPDDVEINITHCGICATDIHVADGGWTDAVNFPFIPGHEVVGIVTQIGSGVAAKSSTRVGDRVGVGYQVWACGQASCAECAAGMDNHCPRGVWSINGKYEDGQYSFGGYAKGLRVDYRYAFKIPASLSSVASEVIAPLLCAGATVYAPIARYMKPGMSVGVIGIGGLGHLAIQFAAKMGARAVAAISSSAGKKADAAKLGATDYIDMSDPKSRASGRRRFDLIINTVTTTGDDVAASYEQWLSLCALGGTLVMVGLPDDHVRFNVFAVVVNRAAFAGSFIASQAEMNAMLDFAGKNKVLPWVATAPLSQATAAVNDVRQGKPRYRLVLDHAK